MTEDDKIIRLPFKARMSERVASGDEIIAMLEDALKLARERKIDGLVLMSVVEDDVDWIMTDLTDKQAAFMVVCLDDLKEELKAVVFEDDEIGDFE